MTMMNDPKLSMATASLAMVCNEARQMRSEVRWGNNNDGQIDTHTGTESIGGKKLMEY